MSQSGSVDKTSTIHLKKGCAKPLHGGHPWVFADAIGRIDGPKAKPGDEVRVVDDRGTFLGRGFFSPDSAIGVRLLSRIDVPIDDALIISRIDEAIRLRKDLLKLGVSGKAETTAYRLINSEGDGLGGLTVDVYGDYLSVQIGTVGMDRRSEVILNALESRLKPKGILDRSDARSRQIEKLEPPKVGPLRGNAPESAIFVKECGIEMICDLRFGSSQKTGLYLDQRENRRLFGSFAAGRDVLDVYSYTGGFSLHAAKSGAKSITLIESSEEALQLAKENLERNGIDDADLVNAESGDGFKHLRDAGRQFDLIVLDPPKFARARENVSQALSGYRDLNAQVMRFLKPAGVLFTCSCSGNVSETDFERAVAAGIRSSGRRAALLERRGACPDHPVPPGFDQGRYLKCLVLQVI